MDKKKKAQREKLQAMLEISKQALYGTQMSGDPNAPKRKYSGLTDDLQYADTSIVPLVDMTPAADTSLALPQQQGGGIGAGGSKGPGMAGNHPSFAMSDILTPALSLLAGIIPDNSRSKNKIKPIDSYNPFAYGTGSQAIFEAGGDIKKKAKKKFPTGGEISGGHQDQVKLMDLVNYSLINRDSRMNKEQLAMFKQKADQIYGSGASQQLLTDIDIFNNDPTYKQYQGEDRINQYYARKAGNPLVLKARKELNSFSGGAAIAYRNSPDVEVQKQQITNQMYSNQQLPRSVANEIITTNKKLAATNFKNGGQLILPKNGFQVEDDAFSPLSNSTIMINGNSHSQGGTDVAYAGQTIEAEAGEPMSFDESGKATIWGNMFVPGTKTKFKSLGKKMADKEAEYEELMEKGGKKLTDTFGENGEIKPKNRKDLLKFNTAKLLLEGGNMGIQDISAKRERMAEYQKAILDTAEQHGVDPIAFSEGKNKKAKAGASIAAAGSSVGGDPVQEQLAIAAKKYGVPLETLQRLVFTESGGKTSAKSDKGALGAMQFMPETAKGYGLTKKQLTSNNPDDIAKVIDAGVKHFSGLLKSNNNDPQLALAAYNGGQGAVDFVKKQTGKDNITGADWVDFMAKRRVTDPTKDTHAWQNETFDYVTKISRKNFNPEEGDAFRSEYYQGNTPAPGEGVDYGTEPEPIWQTLDPAGTKATNFKKQKFQNTPNNNRGPQYQGVDGQGVNFEPLVTNQAPLPTNARRLGITQILPELAAFATNSQDPVFAQQYQPTLYQPYQVSFQDRLNANQSVFNRASDRVGNNAEAQSLLAAQMYGANQQVLGDEFRTNQGISNEVTNKNVGILNDAQLKNLSIRDQQYTRQAQAKSNTKAQNQLIINSIVNKYEQNRLNNQRMAAYENLTDYRFLDNNRDGINETATHFGDAPLMFDGSLAPNADPNSSTRVTQRTNNGFITTSTPSQLQTEKLALDVEQKRRRNRGLSDLFNF